MRVSFGPKNRPGNNFKVVMRGVLSELKRKASFPGASGKREAHGGITPVVRASSRAGGRRWPGVAACAPGATEKLHALMKSSSCSLGKRHPHHRARRRGARDRRPRLDPVWSWLLTFSMPGHLPPPICSSHLNFTQGSPRVSVRRGAAAERRVRPEALVEAAAPLSTGERPRASETET